MFEAEASRAILWTVGTFSFTNEDVVIVLHGVSLVLDITRLSDTSGHAVEVVENGHVGEDDLLCGCQRLRSCHGALVGTEVRNLEAGRVSSYGVRCCKYTAVT